VASACQHDPDVLALEAMGKGTESAGPEFRTEGKNPMDALKTNAADIDSDAPAEPVVDEGGRGSCGDDPVADYYQPSDEVVSKAKAMLGRMNLDQKVTQLVGVPRPQSGDPNTYEDIQRSEDVPDLNLRGYQWRDGPHGLNLEAGINRDQYTNGNYSTSFPTSICQGASFDVDLAERVGDAMGDETAAAGMNVLLAPCMNILRHPFWGRAQETFGEDSFHLGRIASGITVGLQHFVSGCAKHWVANNIENKRFFINANMEEQTLRETYGRHFEMVVRDGGIGCVMASYNSVNGTKVTQDKHVLTDVLRNDFGFRGFILTDWWAMPSDNTGQGPTDAPRDEINAQQALAAGLDVEVPWALNYDSIPRLVTAGVVRTSTVDAAVTRVLEQKFRFGTALINGPVANKASTVGYDSSSGSITGTEQVHVPLAREAAEKGIVLLKNDSNTLPIKDKAKVAVIGATVKYRVKTDKPADKEFNFAVDAALGDRGSSRVRPNPGLTVGPFAGLDMAKPDGVTVVSGSTAADAADADFVVVVVGLTAGDEGEEYTGASDRDSLALPDVHNSLVSSIVALGKPMVVVVEAGGVVDMPWLGSVPAAVMAWYPGQRGGEALGRLLFGQANFSGRLPITWPKSIDQFPAFNEGDTTVMDYFVGYKRFDQLNSEPLFAFGHGLSYASFSYERIHIPCGDVTQNGLLQVEVDVRNTSAVDGDEVVMLFASYPGTTARRPKKELKGFARVSIPAGKAKRVTIPVRVRDLNFWDQNHAEDKDGWTVEAGQVKIQVGSASNKLLLEQSVTINPAG